MMQKIWTRREALTAAVTLGMLPGTVLGDDVKKMRTAVIPASGEALPIIGLGTYSVFDVESSNAEIEKKREIMNLLIANGGCVVDTSPMYDRSEKVIGDVLKSGVDRGRLFIATKVWTKGQDAGKRQMQQSANLMNADVIDLMQVHNLLDTDVHMQTIRAWQEKGRIRYNGITHYTETAFDRLEREMKRHKPQFIQINYSLGEPDAERRILPMAADMGIAVIINRPFQAGRMFRAVADLTLPDFARDFAASWGQFFLKFIVSHPAVTCAIPATSKPHHLIDNVGAGFGELPNQRMRKRMLDYFLNL